MQTEKIEELSVCVSVCVCVSFLLRSFTEMNVQTQRHHAHSKQGARVFKICDYCRNRSDNASKSVAFGEI